MALDRLACLLIKIQSGDISPKVGKALLERVDALRGHFPNDPNRVVGMAVDGYEKSFEKQALKLNRLGKTVENVGKNFDEIKSKKEVKRNIIEAIGGRVEFDKRSILGILSAPFSGVKKLSKIDNISLLKAMFGESKVLKGRVAKAFKAIQKAEEILERSLAEFGEGGSPKPKNSVRVDTSNMKIAEKAVSEFIDDIRGLNVDHLVAAIPYFHKIKGGLDEYLTKIHQISKDGTSMHTDLDWGVSAAQALSDFKKEIYATSSDSYVKFQTKYGSAGIDLVGDFINTSIHMSDKIARMAAFGGDLPAYSKFLKGKLKEKDLLNSETSELIDGWTSYVNGDFDQWSHRNKTWTLIPNVLSIKPYKIMNALKTLAMIKVNIGGVFGALFGDLTTINKAMKDVGLKGGFSLKSTWKKIKADKNLAERMGMATEYLVDRITEQTRYAQEDLGSNFSNKAAVWSSRMSGLEYLTKLRREVMSLDLSHQMANLKVPFDELDGSMVKSLRFADIGQKEWDALLKIDWPEGKGGRMMDPVLLAKTNLPLARKLNAFFEHMKENGIPTNGIRKQKFVKELSKGRGAFSVGAIENAFIFQGWTSSLFENHVAKAWETSIKGSKLNLLKLTAALSVAKLAADVLSNASKNETTNFQDPKTYISPLISSGVFSILGDAAETANSSYGGVTNFLGKKAQGVTIASAVDVGAAFNKAAKRASQNKETQLAYDLKKVADGYNPAKKIWWARGVYDATIGKYIDEKIDEKAAAKAERLYIKRLRKEGRSRLINTR